MNEGTEEQPNDATVRDWYAGQAVMGLTVSSHWRAIATDKPDTVAKAAFDIAEAMMKERKVREIPE